MPRLWKYWQLSNCHRHALREWLLALKRANVARLPHRRYSCVMRPLRYSINVTLDGCCDHRVILPDEDLHRHAVENLNQADALLFGRVTYEMMEAAFRPPGANGSEVWLDGTLRKERSTRQRSTSCRAPWTGSIGTRSSCAGIWGRPFSGSSGSLVREELSSLRRSVPIRTSAFAHVAASSREPVRRGPAGV
jgi:hypothetical protein